MFVHQSVASLAALPKNVRAAVFYGTLNSDDFSRYSYDCQEYYARHAIAHLPLDERVSAYRHVLNSSFFKEWDVPNQEYFTRIVLQNFPEDATLIQVVASANSDGQIDHIIVAAPTGTANPDWENVYRLTGSASIQAMGGCRRAFTGSAAEIREHYNGRTVSRLYQALRIGFIMSEIMRTLGKQMTPTLREQMQADIAVLAPDGIGTTIRKIFAREMKLAY